MIRRMILPVFVAALIASPIVVKAQDAQPQQPPAESGNRDRGDRNRGDRGNWDAAAMRERMNTFMKERLAASDDEFKVIQPKLEKVFELQRDARGGRMFGGRGGPGGRGDSEQQPQSAAQQASNDLDELLQNKDASAEDIAKKLEALRDARAKAKKELTGAQKDLKEILTQRQEAILVQMGMLE